MRVTIKDIAKKTGFAPSTVSLALNNKPFRLPEETRQTIIRTAKEMGYQVNRTAVNLQRQRSNTIGLIVPDIQNDFYSSLAKGAEHECSKHDWVLIIANSDNSQEREQKYIQTLYQRNVDGIIMARAAKFEKEPIDNFSELATLSIPHVLLDLSGSKSSNVVVGDHYRAGVEATNYLISKGHRRIACITGDLAFEGAVSRFQGYKDALAAANIEFDGSLVFKSDYTLETTQKVLPSMNLSSFTAVFASNDIMALAFANFIQEKGYKIPNDFSIIGYDDTMIAKTMFPPLTTIHQPLLNMGEDAAKIIISNQDSSDPQRINYQLKLVERGSVGAPNPIKSIKNEN